jgi:hypothetical protein
VKRKPLLITVSAILVVALFAPLAACGGVNLTTAQLSEATMAGNIDETTYQPIDKTDTFTADVPEIFASVKLSNAPEDTEVSAEWIYVSGELADTENYTIMTLSDNYEGTQYLFFSVSKPETGWPGGNYKVVLSIDGEEQLTIPFTVTSPATPAVPEKPQNLLASDTEYQDLCETFDSWGLDFYSLFTSYSQQGISGGWTVMWLGDDEDESKGVYFKRVGDDWEPYDLTLIPPKPENLLASDTRYQELWVAFDSWELDFCGLFTEYSLQGTTEGWYTMWLGSSTDESHRVHFRRLGDDWEPYDPAVIPPKPETLLASDTEYQELWETFDDWGLDFYSRFMNHSQQAIAEGWDTMWLEYGEDGSQRVYFNRFGNSWEIEHVQEMSVIMPKRELSKVTATFTNTLEKGDVIEGFVDISGEYKTQDWSFDWTGEVLDPNGDTIDIFRGHWLRETRYDLNVEIPAAGEYTIRIRHNSRYQKELFIHIRPAGWQ